MHLLTLKFISGTLDEGLLVELGGERYGLPPAPELAAAQQAWQTCFHSLLYAVVQPDTPPQPPVDQKLIPQKDVRLSRLDAVVAPPNQNSQDNRPLNDFPALRNECHQAQLNREQALNNWLEGTKFKEAFTGAFKQLEGSGENSPTLRLWLCSDSPELLDLPWSTWESILKESKLTIIYGPYNPASPQSPARKTSPKKPPLFLVLLSKGLDLELDKEEKKWHEFVANHPQLITLRLIKNNHLHELGLLWEKPVQTLYFAGHSRTREGINPNTQEPIRQGQFDLNAQETMTLEDLKRTLKNAIDNGTQLAIFNSCDGYGLVKTPAQLGLPHMMIWRENIPDSIAQQFLAYLLEQRDKPIDEAIQKALYQMCELGEIKELPVQQALPGFASTLALYLNTLEAAQEPMLWLPTIKTISSKAIVVCTLISLLLVLCLRSLQLLEPAELGVNDLFLDQHSKETRGEPVTDEPVTIVTIDDEARASDRDRPPGYSSSDRTLVKIIDHLAQARVIGLDLYFDDERQLIDPRLVNLFQTKGNFFSICRIATATRAGTKPPKEISEERIGFSNLALDNHDQVVRRQILEQSKDKLCPTTLSLSLQLAKDYLGFVPIVPEIADVRNGGPYIDPGNAPQILINYKRIIPEITSTDLLMGKFDRNHNLIKDRVVIIGSTAVSTPDKPDYYRTPLHRSPDLEARNKLPPNALPGVEIHAHMTSQLIRAAGGKQSLLSFLPRLWEFILVIVVALLCGLSWFLVIKLKVHEVWLAIGLLSLLLVVIFGVGYQAFRNQLLLPTVPMALVCTGTIVLPLLWWSYTNLGSKRKWL